MFAVIKFVETNEVAVVPFTWISEDQCFWPPKKIRARILPFIEKGISASDAWESYPVLPLGIYATYNEARLKLVTAEEKSDLNTTDPEDCGRGKRQKKRRRLSSSSSTESESIFTGKVRLEEPPSYTPSVVINEDNFRPHIIEFSQKAGTQNSFTLSSEKDAVEKFRHSGTQNSFTPSTPKNAVENFRHSGTQNSFTLSTEKIDVGNFRHSGIQNSFTLSTEKNDVENFRHSGFQNSFTLSTEKNDVENFRHSESLLTPSSFQQRDKSKKNSTVSETLLTPSSFQQRDISKGSYTFSGFELQVLSDITGVNSKLDTVIQSLSSVMSMLTLHTAKSTVSDGSSEVIKDLRKLLPLDNFFNLKLVEEKLNEEGIFDQAVYYLIRVGGSSYENATKLILKKLMTDALATHFSFHGVRNKKAFKPLNLFKVVVAAVQGNFQDAQEALVIKIIGNWLRQAPGRISRKI